MLRLLVNLALAGAFLLVVWTWVPMGGRTLAARWDAAPSAGAFARDAIAEATGGETPRSRSGKARDAQGRAAPRERPPERLTETERQALDRRLAEELRREGGAP
jgi:hypothetical protein